MSAVLRGTAQPGDNGPFLYTQASYSGMDRCRSPYTRILHLRLISSNGLDTCNDVSRYSPVAIHHNRGHRRLRLDAVSSDD